MNVHHCPRCELRFALRGDLVDHLRRDHEDRVRRPAPVPITARIMVPVDPGRPPTKASPTAAGIAGPGTVVELVAVTPPGLPPAVVDAFLAAERDRFPDLAVETVRLDSPDVVGALLERIIQTRPDLVVLDSHGRGPLGELVLGSASADLVRSSPSPTILVGPDCEAPSATTRLVVAVDGSPDSLGALDVASRLSTRLAVPLELVEVAETMPYSSDVAESAELHRLAASVDPPVRRWDVLHGSDVPRALVDHIGAERGVILVVGSHGASPGRPNVMGGTAARTVRHSPVPVLVVSPQAAASDEERHLVAQPASG